MPCSFTHRLSAYHDGELDAAASAEIERHLAGCATCSDELAEIAALGRLIADAPRPRLSQMALYRIHDGVDRVMNANLLRTVKALRAIAACVLVTASLWLMRSSTGAAVSSPSQDAVETESAPPQLAVAVAATAETQSLDATTPAAVWYVADYTSRSEDVP